MKKNALLLFACLCTSILLHAQECEVVSYNALDMMYPAVLLNYPGKRDLDLSKLNLIVPPVKNLSSNAVYKAYIAPSDSSIMVFLNRDRMTLFKMCSSKNECNSFQLELYIENVIIEEFKRLQPAGVFQGTASEADSIIRHIVKAIKDKYGLNDSLLQYLKDTGNIDSYEFSFSNIIYSSNSPKGEDYVGLTNPVSALCNYDKTAMNIDFCGLIDSVRQCPVFFQEEASASLNSSGVRTAFPGMRFRAFDMNGNFIRSGKWSDVYADEFRTPVVVRFENGVSLRYFRTK